MTQEFVTLPREIVEQAIYALYCTNSQEGSPAYNFELKAIKELRAALEQPQDDQEPVAWMYDWDADGELVRDWVSRDYGEAHSPTNGCCNIRPLYTHPQPAQKPLTDDRLNSAAAEGGRLE